MISTTSDDIHLEDMLAARQTVEQAELAVSALLAKLNRAPRAEKVTVSAPLEEALQRLRDARAILDELSDEGAALAPQVVAHHGTK